MSDDADLIIADALVQSALRSLNRALRHAAEHDLVVEVEIERQDLQDYVDTQMALRPMCGSRCAADRGAQGLGVAGID
jgi:hypothetical protein